ncbi:MAG TPA: diacylglycerol kinase family protein [Puia sp.]|nr:diacylglycerol kinase family protein [Puia sp.]
MTNTQRLTIKNQSKSFYHAFSGIGYFIASERNAAIHLAATILAIMAAIFFRVSISEAIALTFVIGIVWIAELFNTCLEKTLDFISIDEHPEIKFIKDTAAGAVLIASITALIVGLFIFIPKIL